MKKLTLALIVITIVIAISTFFKFFRQLKFSDQNPLITPTPEMISITMTPVPTSPYSDEVKAKVRSDFINTCHTQAKYDISVCTCAADYLSKNYSDTDLAKMYLQYHTTKKIPSALEAAANFCLKK